jgi:hypothetical protein
MKALSVRQPWAWLIVNGYKDVENRTWSTEYRGPLLIHAGWHLDPEIEQVRGELAEMGIEVPADLPRGGIVGRVVVVECVTAHDSEWFSGPYGFVLESPEGLAFRPLRGKPGIFEVEVPEG